ncbi:hypothetical protein [Serratia fonticola]|uniref:hypothetical protein n=1 Tax=Serratia fonticola TaxID=47917 RepID=UPI00211C8664|nr:hypothetical protein [Serratia fonticola]
MLLIVRFRNQLIALPQVFRGPALYGFTGPAVKRIIGVGGYLPVRIGPLYQPVPTVIGKGGYQFVGLAAPLYRQVTKAIVLEVPVTKKRQPVARGAVPLAMFTDPVTGRVVQEAFPCHAEPIYLLMFLGFSY